MIDLMRQTIEVLKVKINSNLELIKNNEVQFRKIMTCGKAKEKREELNVLLENNKNLLAKNFDFINVQISLLKFLEKYQYREVFQNLQKNGESIPQYEFPESIDYFEYAVSGKLPFSPYHPLFEDEPFFSRLLRFYEDQENYEKCAELIYIKNDGKKIFQFNSQIIP